MILLLGPGGLLLLLLLAFRPIRLLICWAIALFILAIVAIDRGWLPQAHGQERGTPGTYDISGFAPKRDVCDYFRCDSSGNPVGAVPLNDTVPLELACQDGCPTRSTGPYAIRIENQTDKDLIVTIQGWRNPRKVWVPAHGGTELPEQH